jgi:hypothetical protein
MSGHEQLISALEARDRKRKLEAAAPELAEALKTCEELLRWIGGEANIAVADKARAALTKAGYGGNHA